MESDLPRLRGDRRLRRAHREFALRTPGVAPEKVFVAGQAVDGRAFEEVTPARDTAGARGPVHRPVQGIQGTSLPAGRLRAVPGMAARLRLVGGGPMSEWARQRTQVLCGRRDGRLPIAGRPPGRARSGPLPGAAVGQHGSSTGAVGGRRQRGDARRASPWWPPTAVGAAAGGLVVDGRNGFVVPERDADRARRRRAQAGRIPRAGGAHGTPRAVRTWPPSTTPRMADAFLAAAEHAIAANAGGAGAERDMCGICGIMAWDAGLALRRGDRDADGDETMRHRGPDDGGVYVVAGRCAPRSATAGCRSSICRRPGTSRWPTRTAPSGSPTTARSTTMSALRHRARGQGSQVPLAHRHRGDPPPVRGGGPSVRRAPGRNVRAGDLGHAEGSCFWPVTASASSRWYYARCPEGWCSGRRSRRSSASGDHPRARRAGVLRLPDVRLRAAAAERCL